MSDTNLPKKQTTDSASKVRRYFNTYYGKELAFPSNDVDAVIGFLESKGFLLSSTQSDQPLINLVYPALKPERLYLNTIGSLAPVVLT